MMLPSWVLANRPSLSNTKTGSTESALRPPVAVPIAISPATPDGTGSGMNEGSGRHSMSSTIYWSRGSEEWEFEEVEFNAW